MLEPCKDVSDILLSLFHTLPVSKNDFFRKIFFYTDHKEPNSPIKTALSPAMTVEILAHQDMSVSKGSLTL